MTVSGYLRIFRERWRLIAMVTVLSFLIALGITVATPKQYQASAQVFVASNTTNDPAAQYEAAAFLQSQVSTFAAIVTSPDILHKVESDLNLGLSDQELKAKLSADAPAAQSLVNIHATDGNADQAAALANSTAKAFITAIEGYLTTLGSNAPSVRLYVTDPATAPSSPISPQTLLNLSLGIFLGLLLGAALAVARDLLDNRIKSSDELVKISGAPLMGVIVEDSKTDRIPIATRVSTRSQRAENYRQLRANLQFANVDRHPRVIAVTSAIPGDGKSTVALNLASTLAEAGFSVCLVDADLRRPSVAKSLGLPSPVGLTSVLIHQIDLNEALQSAGSNLHVLTSGPTPPNPSEVLASSYVRDVVRSLLDRADYVIVDTAPLLPVADGSEVAALADGTLLVARYGMTTEAHIKSAVATLSRVDANLLGVVLNRIPARAVRTEYGSPYYRSTDGRGHAQPAPRKRSSNNALAVFEPTSADSTSGSA